MEERYRNHFIDHYFFERIAQYRKGTINIYKEINTIQKPYTVTVKLINAFPDYKNIDDLKDRDPEEMITRVKRPKTPKEAFDYLINCDGKIYFLHQVGIFLDRFGSFKSNYLRAWLVGVEKKEVLSQDSAFIRESFQHGYQAHLFTSSDFKPEHYYCRLKNDYYTINPDHLLPGGVYDRNYAHIIAAEFGQIMFFEFANYLLSKRDEIPKIKKDINQDTLSIKEQEYIINTVNKEIILFLEAGKVPREGQIQYIEKQILAAQTDRPKTPHRDYYIELLEKHLARLNSTANEKYIYQNVEHKAKTSQEKIELYGQPKEHANVFKNELGRLIFNKLLNEWKEDVRRQLANFSFLFRNMKERENLIVNTLRDSDFRLWLNETYEIEIPQTKTWERCQTKEKLRLFNSIKSNIIDSNTNK